MGEAYWPFDLGAEGYGLVLVRPGGVGEGQIPDHGQVETPTVSTLREPIIDRFAHPVPDKYQVPLLEWHPDHLLVHPFLYVDHVSTSAVLWRSLYRRLNRSELASALLVDHYVRQCSCSRWPLRLVTPRWRSTNTHPSWSVARPRARCRIVALQGGHHRGGGIVSDVGEVSEEGHGVRHLLGFMDVLEGRLTIVLVELRGV
ncbi:hypothetical protein GW17_00057666 [Ensete ventricosum]|nr:hypothetical protein GW17_00057666 [Ensete ventricosum]